MKKIFTSLCMCAVVACTLHAKTPIDSAELVLQEQIKFIDSVQSAMKWQTNTVTLSNGVARLKIPQGFKFLNPEQSQYVLHDLWGNPPRPDVLGMIFPENSNPFTDSSFAFIISYDEEGYVKDKDADKIDYDDMFKEMKAGESDINEKRKAEGYEPIFMVGWAQKPYYDKTNKVLHWAKELNFGDAESSTLNYEVRVLGRKGILSLNAIAAMNELPLVKANIDQVLKIPEFTEGNRYADFNESTDKVAEYGIGALVAGGILAKTGMLGVIGKFLLAAWKFIAIGVVALWGVTKRFFTGKKKEEALETTSYYDRVALYKPEDNKPPEQPM